MEWILFVLRGAVPRFFGRGAGADEASERREESKQGAAVVAQALAAVDEKYIQLEAHVNELEVKVAQMWQGAQPQLESRLKALGKGEKL
jgi:hypothetical protein